MSRATEDPEVSIMIDSNGVKLMTNDTALAGKLQGNLHGGQQKSFIELKEISGSPEGKNDEFAKSESLARKLRSEQDFSHRACQRLLREVPWDKLPVGRNVDGPVARERRSSVTLGQYTHGGTQGITRATRLMPELTRYLNQYMTWQGALGPRSSLAISRNLRLAYQKDLQNVGKNWTIAFGKFQGGEVWVEEEGGPSLRQVRPGRWVAGRCHRTHHHLTEFDPKAFHGIEPYRGSRWSVTVYQTRSSQNLQALEQATLGDLGFNLAGYPARDHGRDLAVLDHVFYGQADDIIRPEGSFPTNAEAEDEDEEAEEDNPAPAAKGVAAGATASRARVSEEQKRLIRKLHINTGHPPADRFLRTLKAAGALPHVLEYVRDHFKCDDCAVKVQADSRRRAQCPRLYSFNRVVSVDVMYLPGRVVRLF